MGHFNILCETSIPLSSYEEPDDFVVKYWATIRHDNEPIGEAVLYRVLLGLACNYRQNVFEVFDAHSQGLHDCYAALFDRETDDFTEEIERKFQPCGNDLLIVDSIVLQPKWRGLKLGLLALRRLIDLHQGDCGLVACFPYTLENADTPEQRRAGKVRLRRYFKRLGFQRIARTGWYGLSTTFITPKFEDVLRGSGEEWPTRARRS